MKRLSLWTIAGLLVAVALLFSPDALAAAEEGAKMIGQPHNWALGLQEAASPVKHRMEEFHHALVILITAISVFVLLLLWVIVRYNRFANPVPSKVTHNTMLEVVWTAVPVLILVLMVVPSMQLLYYVDRTHDADMTLTVKGNQWYWTYEYPDHGDITFSSNLVPEKELKGDQVRLLSTDNPVVLPIETNIRLMITATDVLHAWAIPAFGVKLDAVPGQFNETWVRIDKEGTFYGQCSELCGQGHGFMPIEVHAVSKAAFAEWVKAQGGKMPEPKAEKGADGAAGAAEKNEAANDNHEKAGEAAHEKAGEEPAAKKKAGEK